MSIRFDVAPDLQVVVSVAVGEITLGDIEGHRRKLRRHPGFDPGMVQLADLREARFTPTQEELQQMRAGDPFATDARRAILVRDDLHYGVTRIYGARVEALGMDLRPFHAVAEACAWLGLGREAEEAVEGMLGRLHAALKEG